MHALHRRVGVLPADHGSCPKVSVLQPLGEGIKVDLPRRIAGDDHTMPRPVQGVKTQFVGTTRRSACLGTCLEVHEDPLRSAMGREVSRSGTARLASHVPARCSPGHAPFFGRSGWLQSVNEGSKCPSSGGSSASLRRCREPSHRWMPGSGSNATHPRPCGRIQGQCAPAPPPQTKARWRRSPR